MKIIFYICLKLEFNNFDSKEFLSYNKFSKFFAGGWEK